MNMLSSTFIKSGLDLAANSGLNENQTESQDIRQALDNSKIFAEQTPSNRNANQTTADFTSSTLLESLGISAGTPIAKFGKPDLTAVSPFEDKRFTAITIETEFDIGIPGNRIKFDSTPDTIAFQKASNWTPVQILGRPEPIQVYSASNATTFSLEGYFFVFAGKEHLAKLKISDYLMALVTPSKKYFLPTPVRVAIGSWKVLRAIVSNATITFEGPWSVSPDFSNVTPNNPLQWSGLLHAPYLFKAQLSFIMVNKGNEVNYAEDIVEKGFGQGDYGRTPQDTSPEDTSDADPTDTVELPPSNSIEESMSMLPTARSTEGLTLISPDIAVSLSPEANPSLSLPYSIAGPAVTYDLLNPKSHVLG